MGWSKLSDMEKIESKDKLRIKYSNLKQKNEVWFSSPTIIKCDYEIVMWEMLIQS